MTRNTTLMRDGLAIFTFSFLVLALEILDTRIISVILGPNFVYLVVGIGILGFSSAGAYTAYRSHYASGRYTPRPDRYAIAFAFSLVSPVLLICAGTTFLGAGEKIGIGIVCLSLAIPFFFAGLVIVSLLSARAGRIGAVYGLNLAGSAFGCFLPVIGLQFFSAGTLLFSLGLVATLGVFLPGPRGHLSLKGGAVFLNLVLLLIFLPLLNNPFFIRPVSHKELSYLLRERPDMKIEYQKWSPIGRIDVVSLEDPYIFLPGRTAYKLVTQDGNAPTILLSHEKPVREADFARSTILGLPYLLLRNPEVLIIGPGGGPDVAAALYFNASRIVCVELNRRMIEIVDKQFADFTGGIYQEENVHVIHDEGRHFLARTEERYDLIQLTGVDTFMASSLGVTHNINENYLYTLEAFDLYLDRLKEEGILSLSYPASGVAPRLFLMALSALERQNISSPERCIAVGLTKGYNNLLIRKRPFRQEEKEALQGFFQRPLFGILFPLYHRLWGKPDPAFFERDALLYLAGVTEDSIYHDIASHRKAGELDAFLSEMTVNIRPVTDNNPFIFIRDKWFGDRPNFNEYAIIMILLAFSSLALFALPMLSSGFRSFLSTDLLPFLVYFAAIGCGFIMIEITLVQKLILFLGHPAYALMVVIASLLFFAGMGSWYSEKSQGPLAQIGKSVGALAGILPLALLLYHYIFIPYLLHLSFPVRCLCTVLLLAFPGFVLGMPFPLGITLLREKERFAYIPWAWGINGAASVTGSMLNLLFGMTFGFTVTVLAAIGFYAVAWSVLFLREGNS